MCGIHNCDKQLCYTHKHNEWNTKDLDRITQTKRAVKIKNGSVNLKMLSDYQYCIKHNTEDTPLFLTSNWSANKTITNKQLDTRSEYSITCQWWGRGGGSIKNSKSKIILYFWYSGTSNERPRWWETILTKETAPIFHGKFFWKS